MKSILRVYQSREILIDLLGSVLSEGVVQSTMFVGLSTPTYHTSKEWHKANAEKAYPRRARPLQLVVAE